MSGPRLADRSPTQDVFFVLGREWARDRNVLKLQQACGGIPHGVSFARDQCQSARRRSGVRSWSRGRARLSRRAGIGSERKIGRRPNPSLVARGSVSAEGRSAIGRQVWQPAPQFFTSSDAPRSVSVSAACQVRAGRWKCFRSPLETACCASR